MNHARFMALLILLNACRTTGLATFPPATLPPTVADYADAQLKLTPLTSQSPLADLKKPLHSVGIATHTSAFHLADFATHGSSNVNYSNDAIALSRVVLSATAIKSIVDALARDATFGLRVLPAHPAVSVMLIRGSGSGRVHEEYLVDARHAIRLAALVTDASIGTPYFDTCAHWEMNIP